MSSTQKRRRRVWRRFLRCGRKAGHSWRWAFSAALSRKCKIETRVDGAFPRPGSKAGYSWRWEFSAAPSRKSKKETKVDRPIPRLGRKEDCSWRRLRRCVLTKQEQKSTVSGGSKFLGMEQKKATSRKPKDKEMCV